MPVLRENDVLEPRAEPVDDGDHLIAAIDGECAAGAEVILHIYYEQNVGGWFQLHGS